MKLCNEEGRREIVITQIPCREGNKKKLHL